MARRASGRRGSAAIAGAVGLIAAAIGATVGWAAEPVPVPAEPERPQPTGRAIVLVRPSASASAVLEGAELRREISIPQLGAAAVEPPGDSGVAGVRRALSGEPGVIAVEPEYRRSIRLTTNDPAYIAPDPQAPMGDAYQWNLRQQGFQRAWDESLGAGARLAVIDTGIDGANPDLGPRIVAAVDQDATPGVGPATVDEDGHGTHVSGLACASGGNGYGGASSSFGCGLIVEKSDLSDASIADSIVDATDRGADVISMSFGGPGSSKLLENAVSYAWKRDVIMVAAASNEDTKNQGVPAELLQPQGTGPKLKKGKGLVVTAAEYDGSRAWFGPGHGKGVSLAAYGSANSTTPGIFSNFPANLTLLDTGTVRVPPCMCRTSFEGDRRFAYLEGTSMATPQVAGAAALIRSRKSGKGAKSVIKLLKKQAHGENFHGSLGWGILNAGGAMKAVAGG
jgi:serine protease